MQSGKAKDSWILEFEPASPHFVENLMGWTGSDDTTQQIRLKFKSSEEAVAYAERNHLPYEVYTPHQRTHNRKAYADNFRYNKPKNA